MRALRFESFGGPLEVVDVRPPEPSPGGVVVRVEATGVCRSDWSAWQGADLDVRLPHVPGHELAGTVTEVGEGVGRWRGGERVTVPFVCACGQCPVCAAGQHQVCPRQTQPGSTQWGSFAELVALQAADVNLVALPDTLPSVAAASLGCRTATAYRAVVQQGRVRAGQWLAVHGCGGLGLAAVQVARAAGARVVAVDLQPGALALAERLGAEHVVDGAGLAPEQVAQHVAERTDGGAHVSLDAVGSTTSCVASVLCLRPRGRHVQVGLLPRGAPMPMDRVVARELSVLGSHGMAAHSYPELLALVVSGRLRPQDLVTADVPLEGAGDALRRIGTTPGLTVVRP